MITYKNLTNLKKKPRTTCESLASLGRKCAEIPQEYLG